MGYLPAELIHIILIQAWTVDLLAFPVIPIHSSSVLGEREVDRDIRARRRWQFYNTCRLVSRDWYHMIVDIPLQEVLIVCGVDIVVYPRFLKSRMEKDIANGVHISPQDYLSRARVKVVCLKLPTEFFTQSLPNSRSVTLWIFDADGWDRFVECLSRHPSLSSLLVVYSSVSSLAHLKGPPPFAGNITRLLVHFPGPVSVPLTGAQLARNIFTPFFNTIDLTLSHDIPLIDFVTRLPKLQCLTLQCYPLYTLFGRAGMGTLWPWRIIPALRAGLLQGEERQPNEGGRTGKGIGRLIINTGYEEPYGWAEVADACVRYGVTLERRPIFTSAEQALQSFVHML
ncbi:hypothetical protein JAAARDRAFT_38666 [Jaapia argillacea MUCL 33604]|uniref:F-box domain-containing protein n=1 Tax=Jaapia argillacea MUCL 33604 TaxID=933084 RepID=A0A067PRY8_9AGAM|nr:hypothetical protein JAAARDRAFT_38666 [Jaapia argillacea MUCL 33604]